MTTTTAGNPATDSGLQTNALEELVKAAEEHGQRLVNAGVSVLAVQKEHPLIFEREGDPDLFAFLRGRAARASAWWREVGNGETVDPTTADCLEELDLQYLDHRLPGLVMIAHVAHLDPCGDRDVFGGDLQTMGCPPWEVAANEARALGQILKEWASKHYQEADAA